MYACMLFLCYRVYVYENCARSLSYEHTTPCINVWVRKYTPFSVYECRSMRMSQTDTRHTISLYTCLGETHIHATHSHCIRVWVHIYMYTSSLSVLARHNYTQHILSLYKYVGYFMHAWHTRTENFFLFFYTHSYMPHPLTPLTYTVRECAVYICVCLKQVRHTYTRHTLSLTHSLTHSPTHL